MLVLSRKVGEKIELTDGQLKIVVQVTEIDRGKVRLAFTAPQYIKIMRSEILEEQAANLAANADQIAREPKLVPEEKPH